MKSLEKIKANIDEVNIMHKTFDEMPNRFTGFLFNKVLIKNGYSANKARRGTKHRNFLRNMAENLGYKSKTWIKKPEFQKETGIFSDENFKIKPAQPQQLTEQRAIEFLKSKGYKIMKPVSNWEEI